MEILPSDASRVRLLRIDFQPDAAIDDHPEVAPLLRDGWHIRRRTPRLVEREGVQLFIVLTRPANPTP